MIKLHLFNSAPYFDTPYHLIGWLGWFFMAAVILWVVRNNLEPIRSKKLPRVFIFLGVGAVISAFFFGFDLPFIANLPLPNVPVENQSPAVMVFSMIPILLAAGMLGVWPAALLGFISGIISALWNTHSIFTPLETSALALILALVLRQSYRTRIFIFMRRPIGAALTVFVLSVPLFLVSTFFSTNGSLAARLDYSFTRSWILILVNGIQLLIAGLVCELLKVKGSPYWIQQSTLKPSPMETGLQNRILYTAIPMVLVLMLTLSIADWVVAGKAARDVLVTQLENSSKIAAENIPAILETGRSLATSLVDVNIPINEPEQLTATLHEKIREIPFFNQFYVFDLTGAPVTGYPVADINQFRLSTEEEIGIQLALNGVLVQHYVTNPLPGEESAIISFITTIPDEYGLAKGVIVSRTNFSVNLFSQPALLALESIANAGGQGLIMDETNQILFHTNPNLVMTTYSGILPPENGYFEDPGSTGTRQLNYVAESQDNGWKVVLSLPASYSQETALRIAIPLLVISIVISLLAFLLLRYMMRSLTSNLVHLAQKADEISRGDLEDRVEVKGLDEIGRLGSAFEQMRQSLKSRLEELDAILKVSQGVSTSLDIESASVHLLEAILSYGGDAASLVLIRNSRNGWEDEHHAFRSGEFADTYAYLDDVLLEQVREESILIVPSRSRIRRMGLPDGVEIPSALAAISLKSDEEYSGFIWVVYSQPHRFLDPEVRFLNTLAGQAVLAVTNSILFLKSEVGMKRLESVLTSTPEPVLVVGRTGQLLIVNEAAREMTDLIRADDGVQGLSGEVISERLNRFLNETDSSEERAQEITLEDGKTYVVSVSPVEVEQAHVGKVCVLRDVTAYKLLEKMKSEYIYTVSHDLKYPLGLIRGYASMLPMVGELTEQQREYNRKIIEGIDDISKMADNLLDIRRIDSGIKLQIEDVSPLELFENVLDEIQSQIRMRKIQVMRELTLSQDLTIEADKALLQRALYNLVDNAVKFSPIGGQVNLRLQVNDSAVVFQIEDHGPGIAPIDQPMIFEPARRNYPKEGGQQTEPGLGLSIVKSIAERHQGRVWVDSLLGKGSTFYLEIPIRHQG